MTRTIAGKRKTGGDDWHAQLRRAQRAGQSHGYLAVLGMDSLDTPRLLDRVEAGLPFSTFAAFVRTSGLPTAVAADLVGLTARTLARRKLQKRLRPDESDRLVRAARLYADATELFEGDESEARRWLNTPQPALGGMSPIRYATTEIGAREVAALIGRLEHGIPS